MSLPTHTVPAAIDRRPILDPSAQCSQRAPKTISLSARVPLSLIGIAVTLALVSSLTGCSQTGVSAQPTSSATAVASRIDVSAIATQLVDQPERLCGQIFKIKTIPFHANQRDEDLIYDEMMAAGDRLVPCLIERVTDITSMENLNEDFGKVEKSKVGDVAVEFLQVMAHLDLKSLIPEKFFHNKLDDPYFAYVEKPERRKELQEKLWDWYHRTYQTSAQRRAQRVTAGQLRQVKTGSNSNDTARLIAEEGRCILIYTKSLGVPKEGSLTLDVPSPCEFVRDETGEAELFSYLEENKLDPFLVLMVVGGPLNPTRSDRFMKTGCGTQIQAIKMSDAGLPTDFQKKAVGTGITVCPSEGVREKIYALLAKRK